MHTGEDAGIYIYIYIKVSAVSTCSGKTSPPDLCRGRFCLVGPEWIGHRSTGRRRLASSAVLPCALPAQRKLAPPLFTRELYFDIAKCIALFPVLLTWCTLHHRLALRDRASLHGLHHCLFYCDLFLLPPLPLLKGDELANSGHRPVFSGIATELARISSILCSSTGLHEFYEGTTPRTNSLFPASRQRWLPKECRGGAAGVFG